MCELFDNHLSAGPSEAVRHGGGRRTKKLQREREKKPKSFWGAAPWTPAGALPRDPTPLDAPLRSERILALTRRTNIKIIPTGLSIGKACILLTSQKWHRIDTAQIASCYYELTIMPQHMGLWICSSVLAYGKGKIFLTVMYIMTDCICHGIYITATGKGGGWKLKLGFSKVVLLEI